MIIPAQRVYYFLILGCAIAPVLAMFTSLENSFILLMAFDFTILSLTIIDGKRVKKNQVSVQRNPIGKLSIGRENPITITLEAQNQSSVIILKDDYPCAFQVSHSTLQTTLAAQTTGLLTYTVSPDCRGEFLWGDIQVRQLGKWGLGWSDWKVTASQKVMVYPDLIALRSLSLRLSLNNSGRINSRLHFNQGTEFSELREYVQGEDPRLIDWKATARHQRTMIRVLESEREQPLIILLDRGRLMTAQVEGLKRFDWGLNSALSLALAGLNRSDRVGIGVFDREIITWIPPERGQNQLFKIIERLTPLQPQLLEPDYFQAVTKLVNQETRRALVVLITDIIDTTASAELLAAMQRLTPRYLPFCVTLRDPQVDETAHRNTQTISDLYRRSVALDLLSQRRVALAQLQQKGVLVLDAPVNNISEELVNRYLLIKARNLL